jgi:hypothetical protein
MVLLHGILLLVLYFFGKMRMIKPVKSRRAK